MQTLHGDSLQHKKETLKLRAVAVAYQALYGLKKAVMEHCKRVLIKTETLSTEDDAIVSHNAFLINDSID